MLLRTTSGSEEDGRRARDVLREVEESLEVAENTGVVNRAFAAGAELGVGVPVRERSVSYSKRT